MVALSVSELMPDGFAVVQILPFAVFELAQKPLPVQPAHFARTLHEAIIFGIEVGRLAALHRVAQLRRLAQVLRGQHFADDRYLFVKAAHGVRRVLVGIIGKHHAGGLCRKQPVKFPDEQRRGAARLAIGAHVLQHLFVAVAHRHELPLAACRRMIEEGLSPLSAKYGDPRFFHRPPLSLHHHYIACLLSVQWFFSH